MKRVMAVRIAEPAQGLEVVEVPEPTPGPGEVLVQMKARPIQPADLLIVRGRHIVQPALPDPVGIEGAGVVIGHGEGVSAPPIGAPVALPFGGTWSERIVVPASAPIPLPEGCELLQGAMLALNPVTAMGLLAGLQAGDWLIQNAANSALGKLITRLATARGIHSISVVRRAGMEAELGALGAELVLTDGPDLAERVRAFTGGAGATRALDAVAGEASGRLFDATAEGGELWCYGLLGSDSIVLPAARAIFRDVTVRGYSRLRKLRALSPAARDAMQRELLDAFERGLFETPIVATFPLERVSEAVTLAEQVGGTGKVLLVSPDLLGDRG
jgi:trans-2-enoyl-CoA reductase